MEQVEELQIMLDFFKEDAISEEEVDFFFVHPKIKIMNNIIIFFSFNIN